VPAGRSRKSMQLRAKPTPPAAWPTRSPPTVARGLALPGGAGLPVPLGSAVSGPGEARSQGRAQRERSDPLTARPGLLGARPTCERSEHRESVRAERGRLQCAEGAKKRCRPEGRLRFTPYDHQAFSRSQSSRAARIARDHSQQDQAVSISHRRDSRAFAVPGSESMCSGCARGLIREGGCTPSDGGLPR
jgi:hypothetical protein